MTDTYTVTPPPTLTCLLDFTMIHVNIVFSWNLNRFMNDIYFFGGCV